MPFKSEKQRRYLFANEPEVAKKFAKDYNMGGVASMFRKRLADGDDPFYDAWKKVYETNPDAASMNEKHDEYLEKYTLEMSTQTSEAPTEDVEQTTDPMLNLFSETDALNNDQALTTLFAKEEPQGIMAAKGGRIGFRGGGQDASSDDFGGSTSSGDQGETSSDSGFSGGDTSSNNNNNNDNNSPDTGGHSRFDVGSGYYGEEVTTSSDDGSDDYKDPILDMVGKKIVKDPTTGADIVVDSNAVLMKEKKLKMSKGKRPAAWVDPETKAYYDNLDKYIADNTGLLSSYNIEKELTNFIIDQIPVIGRFIPDQYPSRNINFEKIGKYEVPGSDLGFYDPDEYPEFYKDGPDEKEDNDGPVNLITGEVSEDVATGQIDLMSALDKIRANQLRRKGLVEDGIIQDNETMELASLPKTKEEFKLNSGGLANLFRVKTQ
tara:strand:+ start:2622 stop:3923 length:1302 start_codon:yes stop_codon:yes gene_type:complete